VKPTVYNNQDINSIFNKGMKVEIPYFNGNDAKDWVFKIKEFFELYCTPMDQRRKVTSMHLETLLTPGTNR